jgi:tetratricopeptide (TPR) repeat protein
VLEGGVRKSGDRLRITVQLVDVAGGSPRWAHRFDGSLDEVFEIQDQIAESVATTLRGMLSTEERESCCGAPEVQVEAYEHFLRGRQLLHAQTSMSFVGAEREFLRATEIDPSYAPAYAGLAQVYMWKVDWLGGGEPARQAADRASRRALELGPQLSESHVARGAFLTSICDYAGAEREYREAIRLNPRSFEAHYLLARCGVHGGNFELAAEMFKRAAELRPEDFQSCAIAEVPLNRLGRFEEAKEYRREGLRRIERHLELDPRDPRALILGAIILVADGEREKGFQWATIALAQGPEDAATLINAACMYARAGLKEEALQCLEKSFGRGWGKRDWVNNDPDYDSIRGRSALPGPGREAELAPASGLQAQSSLGPATLASGPRTGVACSAGGGGAGRAGAAERIIAAASSSCDLERLASVRNTPGVVHPLPVDEADMATHPKSTWSGVAGARRGTGPRPSRHLEVQHDERRAREPVEDRQRLAALASERHPVAGLLEGVLEGLAEEELVVGDEDVGCGTHGAGRCIGCHQAHLPVETGCSAHDIRGSRQAPRVPSVNIPGRRRYSVDCRLVASPWQSCSRIASCARARTGGPTHGPVPRRRPGRRAGRRSANSETRVWISSMSKGFRIARMTPGSFPNHSGSTSADITMTSKSAWSGRRRRWLRNVTPSITGMWRSRRMRAGRRIWLSATSASAPFRVQTTEWPSSTSTSSSVSRKL